MRFPRDWQGPRWVPLTAYDLVSLESEEERSAARRHVYHKLSVDWQFWGVIAVVMGLVMPVTIWGTIRLAAWLPSFRIAVSAVLGALVGGGVTVLVLRAFHRKSQRILRAYLVDRGVPVCLACGYFRRGAADARCPECGVVAITQVKAGTV